MSFHGNFTGQIITNFHRNVIYYKQVMTASMDTALKIQYQEMNSRVT